MYRSVHHSFPPSTNDETNHRLQICSVKITCSLSCNWHGKMISSLCVVILAMGGGQSKNKYNGRSKES